MQDLVLKAHVVQVGHVVPNGQLIKEAKALVLICQLQPLHQKHIADQELIQVQRIVLAINALLVNIKMYMVKAVVRLVLKDIIVLAKE